MLWLEAVRWSSLYFAVGYGSLVSIKRHIIVLMRHWILPCMQTGIERLHLLLFFLWFWLIFEKLRHNSDILVFHLRLFLLAEGLLHALGNGFGLDILNVWGVIAYELLFLKGLVLFIFKCISLEGVKCIASWLQISWMESRRLRLVIHVVQYCSKLIWLSRSWALTIYLLTSSCNLFEYCWLDWLLSHGLFDWSEPLLVFNVFPHNILILKNYLIVTRQMEVKFQNTYKKLKRLLFK